MPSRGFSSLGARSKASPDAIENINIINMFKKMVLREKVEKNRKCLRSERHRRVRRPPTDPPRYLPDRALIAAATLVRPTRRLMSRPRDTDLRRLPSFYKVFIGRLPRPPAPARSHSAGPLIAAAAGRPDARHVSTIRLRVSPRRVAELSLLSGVSLNVEDFGSL
ncbi:hypothetical protein EVAR_44138_1 [Eumeta japonica]|uniref:Uncharacterized protein n=1 Tax=Eumeta variegata TaxID=151549 RepID=A0A4C1XPC5_EUMVA|nr:hypothetical protein EVAR_44138_1 [Eumeta japonica]